MQSGGRKQAPVCVYASPTTRRLTQFASLIESTPTPAYTHHTVGRVCQEFGQHFRRTRGMYFSTADRGQFSAMYVVD